MTYDDFRSDLNNRMVDHYQATKDKPLIRPDEYAEQLISTAALLDYVITQAGANTQSTILAVEQMVHIAAEMFRYGEALDLVIDKPPPPLSS